MVYKLFANRDRDVIDAEGIGSRQRKTLDWQNIEDRLAPLAEVKDDPSIMARFASLRSRYSQPLH